MVRGLKFELELGWEKYKTYLSKCHPLTDNNHCSFYKNKSRNPKQSKLHSH